jgi:hypothetical protein
MSGLLVENSHGQRTIRQYPSTSREKGDQSGECPPDNKLPENSKENLDAKLDHAIEETFPTSDPVSVTITKGEPLITTIRQNRTQPSASSIR